jgi:hypothetical protein
MVTTIAPILRRGGARARVASIGGLAAITRRLLQIALGLLWLLDGLLQAQPFMFTRGVATEVIAYAPDQPRADAVRW